MSLVRSQNTGKSPWVLLLLVLALFFIDHSPVAQAQTPIYPVTAPPVSLPLTGYPIGAFAVGDFKGNGEADLAYTTSQTSPSNSLFIVLDITGSSPTVVSTPLNCTPVSGSAGVPVLGDVNNDGKLDVVLSCTNYVVVLLGKGDGTFQSPAYYAVNTLSSPTLVDLNGDHYLDIAVFSSGTSGSQVTVFLNDGSTSPGVFGAAANYSAGTAQEAPSGFVLASGDFNGDGKQDVIASASNGFVLFLGNGDGTLQPASVQSVIAGNFPLSFTVGDFNQDGITDVAVLSSSIAAYQSSQNPSYSDIQILLGSSSGNLTQGANLPLASPSSFGQSFVGITTAALTSGGNLDLIVGGNYTTVFQGDGKGNFTQPISFAAFGIPFVFDVNGNGKPDLLLVDDADSDLSTLTGNGDGTFQGLRTTPINGSNIVSADFNNDGVEDVAFVPQQSTCGQAVISVELGRGDGTFASLDQSTPTAGSTCNGVALIPGDLNQDGKTDLLLIAYGHPYESGGVEATPNQIFFYAGNGNGTFQAAGPALNLGGADPGTGIVGDFNGDGKLDLIVSYAQSLDSPGPTGLMFVPGNGDGTFGTPVPFSQLAEGTLFAADLNHDGKLDLILGVAGGGTVFLGNGDGTFKQIPLNLGLFSGYIAALVDVNGDGYPDLVTCGDGASVYAGNGDGTFQTSPLYTSAIPQYYTCQSAAAGDIDGDGNPDLVTYSYNFTDTPGHSQLSVSYGDGHGNFTADPNTYFSGAGQSSGSLLLTRLNNNAPAPSSDHTLDALVTSDLALTVLLNQKNPAPSAPAVFTSSMTLQSSAASANENASITLTAAVLGTNPTGDVVFSSNGTSLGTAPLSNGTATLQTSFASAGTYAVTASYQGDKSNSASLSNSVSITVAAPDFTITSNPTSATITPGQSATFSLTLTPIGGYAGTVNLSCGSLPSKVTCSFSPSAITPINGSSAKGTLTISTTAAVAALDIPPAPGGTPWLPAGTLTVAGLLGLFINPRRLTRWNRRLWMLACVALLCSAGLCLSGCGGSSTNSSGNQGTPPGSYAIVVSLTDSAGGPAHTLNLNVTVQ